MTQLFVRTNSKNVKKVVLHTMRDCSLIAIIYKPATRNGVVSCDVDLHAESINVVLHNGFHIRIAPQNLCEHPIFEAPLLFLKEHSTPKGMHTGLTLAIVDARALIAYKDGNSPQRYTGAPKLTGTMDGTPLPIIYGGTKKKKGGRPKK